jgi:hypothetical protein
VRTKQEIPHKADCFAVKEVAEGRWTTPWCPSHPGHDHDRQANGRRNGSHLWMAFDCNDPDCPAKLLVHAGDLADAIHAAHEANETSRAVHAK